ncbi:QueT transporter family protein [Eubacteriales bacterium OttesenSCG-928-M02]|nr:QueT transporter family protein [Eubacteriales bacterium OttesenSCG-928-M02]
MKQKSIPVRTIVESGLIAALYVLLVWVFEPISFGMVQVRIAEALYVFIFFTQSGVWGVSIGCLLANILFPHYGLLDIILGTLATFLGAVIVYLFREHRYLALLGPVFTNGFIVAAVLYWAAGFPYWINVLYIAAGEALALYCIGYFLTKALDHIYPRLS